MMVQDSECRRFSRLSTGPDYGVRFRIAGQEIAEAQLQNVSAGGCGMQVPMEYAGPLEVGLKLEELYLDHPWLPYVPLECQIVRLLGKVPGKTAGYVLVGVEFTSVTPLIQVLIQAHVEECLMDEAP
jgi:hypothetical protein